MRSRKLYCHFAARLRHHWYQGYGVLRIENQGLRALTNYAGVPQKKRQRLLIWVLPHNHFYKVNPVAPLVLWPRSFPKARTHSKLSSNMLGCHCRWVWGVKLQQSYHTATFVQGSVHECYGTLLHDGTATRIAIAASKNVTRRQQRRTSGIAFC